MEGLLLKRWVSLGFAYHERKLGLDELTRFQLFTAGLGKTVISLALILQNPAPTLPLSGSPITCLNRSQTSNASVSQQSVWDQNLYEQTSVSNKKRGSIISRGTLVVCPGEPKRNAMISTSQYVGASTNSLEYFQSFSCGSMDRGS